MAGIDLLSIEPHKVSRDMRGYSVLFFGDIKSGKTYNATRFPKHLLVAAEKGYSAIPGAMAIPVNSWADFRKVLRQLKEPEVQEKFETVILDVIDILADYCEKYICANAKRPDGTFGYDSIGEIPYGQGYSLMAKEFDEALRTIIQLDYGLVLISHSVDKTFRDEAGNEYNKIVPTLTGKAKNIALRTCDIVAYSRLIQNEDGSSSPKLFLRGTPRFEAGSRFKYITDCIDFTYNDLVNAIGDAIDKEEQEMGSDLFTNQRNNLHKIENVLPSFDELITQFNAMVESIIKNNSSEYFESWWQPRIVEITERYLGKGRKVNQCSRDQTEALSLIVDDLNSLINNSENKIDSDENNEEPAE